MSLPMYAQPKDLPLAQAAAALAAKEGLSVSASETTLALLRRVAVKVGAKLPHRAGSARVFAALLAHYAGVSL